MPYVQQTVAAFEDHATSIRSNLLSQFVEGNRYAVAYYNSSIGRFARPGSGVYFLQRLRRSDRIIRGGSGTIVIASICSGDRVACSFSCFRRRGTLEGWKRKTLWIHEYESTILGSTRFHAHARR